MKKEVTIQFDNAKASEPQKAILDGDFSGGGGDIFEVSIPSDEQTRKMYTFTDGNNDNMITVITTDFDDNTIEKLNDDSTNAVLAKVGHETFVLNKTSSGYGTAACKFMPDDNLVMTTNCGLYSDDDNEKTWRFVMTVTIKSVQPATM